MPLPIPAFTPWFPWSHIDGGTPADIAEKLRKVGCYLLARFDGDASPGPADAANPAVFYIGETHGNSTSLWGRLGAFGTSAGFYGGQWNGHYGAWGYPDLFPQDVVGTGKGGAGKSCSPQHVFVALCPWPGGMPPHLRGIFPTAIEQQALWRHAETNSDLPKLNNSGRVRSSIASMPTVTDAELDAVLASATSPAAANVTVGDIAQRLATKMGYAASRKSRLATYGRWRGAERILGREYLLIGWNDADPDAVDLRVYHVQRCVYDGGAARTRDELRAMLDTFWSAWHA
jgi:hypothetical protein